MADVKSEDPVDLRAAWLGAWRAASFDTVGFDEVCASESGSPEVLTPPVLSFASHNRIRDAFHFDEGWRGLLLRTDWLSVAILLILSFGGCPVIYAASKNSITPFWSQQLLFVGVGWAAYLFLSLLDYDFIRRHARYVFFAGVALLIPVAISAVLKKDFGTVIKSVNGARRWIDLGPMKIQPSEFAKVTTLVMLAAVLEGVRSWDWRFFRRNRGSRSSAWIFNLPQVRVAGAALLPIGLIFVQPDLKSCIVYLPMLAALLYVSRVSLRFFVVVVVSAVIGLGVIGADMTGYARHLEKHSRDPEMAGRSDFARRVHAVDPYEKKSPFILLKDYQRERILSFVRPDIIDPTGSGTSWNVKQAIIATGRGGLYGTGWCEGLQARLGYMPELAAHNDFVFSSFAEEFGFVGGACLLAAYAFLIGLTLRTAARARDRFGALLCVGAAAVFTVHVVVNIGMNIGLMPVSGLPLPFLSYGGSFVLSCFLLLGLVQSVHRYSRELPPRSGFGPDISTNALKGTRIPV